MGSRPNIDYDATSDLPINLAVIVARNRWWKPGNSSTVRVCGRNFLESGAFQIGKFRSMYPSTKKVSKFNQSSVSLVAIRLAINFGIAIGNFFKLKASQYLAKRLNRFSIGKFRQTWQTNRIKIQTSFGLPAFRLCRTRVWTSFKMIKLSDSLPLQEGHKRKKEIIISKIIKN